MKIKLFLSFLFTLGLTSTYAQFSDDEIRSKIENSDEKTLLKDNSHLMQEGFLYQAEWVSDKLLTFQPENPNYNYRKGFLVLEIRKDYLSAMPYFKKAITNTKPHFDAFSTEEKSAPADAFYHLGLCYHLNNEIDSAIRMYNLFLTNTNQKSSLIPTVKIKILQCEEAKKAFAQPVKVSLKNIGKTINGSYPDYSPVISLDGSSLYFTSRRPWEGKQTENFRDPGINQYPEDVYVSYLDYDSTWTTPSRLDFCLPKRNEATIAVSSDERRIYLYEDSTGSGDIYYSDFYTQKFNDIALLNEPGLNTPYWETHCYMNKELTHMFFSSDRPGGLGGRDLYYCEKSSDGKWSTPMNMGPSINSEQDEDSPFVSIDGKQLYFSSNSAKSIGGFDIFVSELQNDGKWSTPKNLGYPFNSTNDDIFYTTTIDGLKGYMTSFRSDGFGEKDIYEIKNDFLGVKSVAVLKGLIRTRDKTPLPEDFPIAMELKCLDCKDNIIKRTIYPRLRDGVFVTDLKPCQTYELVYVNPNDSVNMYKNTFKTECTEAYQEIHKEVILDKVRKTIVPAMNYRLDGIVADKQTNKPLETAKIEVFDARTNALIETVSTRADGSFDLNFIKDKFYGDTLSYSVKVSKENYLTNSFALTTILGDEENIHLDYKLDLSTVGADLAGMFDIKPIYFDFDKSNIRPDAKIELDKIVKIMNDNPTLEIEYGSHTDCRGTAAYNMALSDRRAKASAAYIKARITNPKRIHGKGYGETKLVNRCECEGDIVSDCTAQEHQANRRTEFIIVKK
jgi:outer membrane protein OmpA-like peptidoglycan-associated protein